MSAIYVLSILQANQNIREKRDELIENKAQLENSNERLAKARDVEKEQRLVMERQAYQSAILLAENHVESFRPSAARHVLMSAPENWRNWEWGYLFKRLDPSVITFTSHLKGVSSAEFSPDGRRIVTASEDKTLMLWDTETGERFRTLIGHGEGVLSGAFSLDGRYVAGASTDGDVRVWNAATGETLSTFGGGGKAINRAVFPGCQGGPNCTMAPPIASSPSRTGRRSNVLPIGW